MLEAASVAVVGASPRPGSVGRTMLEQLLRSGYGGEVYAVNPRYDEIDGHRSYASLTDIGRPVDLAILGVPNSALEEQVESAAENGCASLVIFASCIEDPPRDPRLSDRITATARSAGMVVCGGNGMGFVNVERRLRALAFAERDLTPGPVTFLSHSGSVFTAMLHNYRGLRFNLAVSAGQEMTTTVADYMHYALDQPSTGVVGMFIETIRDPENFAAAVRRASEKEIPVVALKVGSSERSREFVAAHSGALAGDDGAYEALFETYGVVRVKTLEEMADTLELMGTGRKAGPGALAAIHDSGGERAHLIDLASEMKVPFARISDATMAKLSEHLDPGLPPSNPLDAWGTGAEYEAEYEAMIRILLDDPDTACFAFVADLAGEELEAGYTRVAERVFATSEKPFAVLSNLASAIPPQTAARLRAKGIPVLEGTSSGLAAFEHLLFRRDFRMLPPPSPPEPPPGMRERWGGRLTGPAPLPERTGLELLGDYRIPVVEALACSSEDETVGAAASLGYPVVLKSAAPGLAHKTDAGGVALGLRDEDGVREAYRGIRDALGPGVVVQPQVEGGVELALGMVSDPQFGPLVLVGAGGVLTEFLSDRRMALPPLDHLRARRLLDRLRVRPLLDGYRGAEAADIDAVVDAVVALSVLAADLGDRIEALDVNPLICGPSGCTAVDALVIPKD